jgi:hypothetical protein
MRRIAVLLALGLALSVQGVGAQTPPFSGSNGPPDRSIGQDVPQPPMQCGPRFRCSYQETVSPDTAYRIQALSICGNNCSGQYWISDAADGHLLLSLGPVAGGATLALGTTSPHPDLRIIRADYQPADALCCPTQFTDTTYGWDASRSVLTAGTPIVIPPGYYSLEAMRLTLERDHFTELPIH